MKNILNKLNPSNYKKKTKIALSVIAVFLIVVTVLGISAPPMSSLQDSATEEMKAAIAQDEKNGTFNVTKTLNNLFVVKLVRYEKKGMDTENYIGFCGQIMDVGSHNNTANLINYTYRILGIGQPIVYGAKLTIFLTVTSVMAGLLLSTLLALGKMSPKKWISGPCSAYIFVFRGTPLMLQLLCIYYLLPAWFNFSWRGLLSGIISDNGQATIWGAFICAFITFSLNSAAYCAEIVRAAIQSIDKGQNEAGKALGLTGGQVMSNIIIPQTFRRLVPPIANEFIMVLKDASIVTVISMQDITTISKTIAGQGSYLVFLPAMIVYLLITWVFSIIFNKLEKKFSIYE